MMNNLKRKKSVRQTEKGPTKRFSYDLMGQKRLGEKIEKEISELTSRGILKRAQKKEGNQLFFALRHKESGSGLCLKLNLLRKKGLLLKFTSKRSLRDKERKTHK